ncbi:hypothetical protein ADICEAN_02406 [Cesiribacter andamanensis AMV16]|uniref:Uncharacterized protein n=1 Tax=Cesiribacter andamanensis AMV16 TaxID=1279009 RepID=M7NL03_9BACT|nr:hypothetical protein ADICEAN_02406 [Cesiribacter andamanensis AMV16]
MLDDINLYYLPGMTQQEYLELQKNRAFPVFLDPFFHNINEIRWYNQSLYHIANEGGRQIIGGKKRLLGLRHSPGR